MISLSLLRIEYATNQLRRSNTLANQIVVLVIQQSLLAIWLKAILLIPQVRISAAYTTLKQSLVSPWGGLMLLKGLLVLLDELIHGAPTQGPGAFGEFLR